MYKRLILVLLVGIVVALPLSSANASEIIQSPSEMIQWDPDRAYNGYNAVIKAGVGYLLDMEGYIVTYRLKPDGTLAATATRPDSAEIYETTFRRIPDPAAGDDGGTVGAVVRDRCGDLAAGTSTGGFGSKTPGRVGDSPIIGAGTYADNETAAISATGHGEFFMRHVAAYAITAAMKHKGLTLEQAATGLIEQELFRKGLRGGVIAVDRDGNVAMPYNTEGMVRGAASNDMAPVVEVF